MYHTYRYMTYILFTTHREKDDDAMYRNFFVDDLQSRGFVGFGFVLFLKPWYVCF